MRTLKDLISDDPAWQLVREWISAASNRVEVLPASDPDRSRALEEMQVTTRSPMGAVIYETGGLLIDRGWLRILGSGHPQLPRTLPAWNKGRTWSDGQVAPPILVVADDVVGGSFAINGGALDGPQGHVHYFAPNRWSGSRSTGVTSISCNGLFRKISKGFTKGNAGRGGLRRSLRWPATKPSRSIPFSGREGRR